MDWLLDIDWHEVLNFQKSPLEIFVRGTITYLFLFIVLRFYRRQAGALSVTNLLVIVLMADAGQNAMAGDYKSIPDGILLVLTIFFWDYFLDWLAYNFPKLEYMIHAEPTSLIKNGRLMRKNMRHEMITENEIIAQLHEQGVENISEVKKACIEGDGKISIIKYKKEELQTKPRRQTL